MASVRFEHVRRSFPSGVVAVDDLDLDVADGELLVLVGPSGSGKTTVLRMVAGLDRPTSGAILIDGRPVGDTRPQDRDFAMTFQEYALYPHMTAEENLGFPLRVRGVHARRVRERVREIASILHIDDVLERRPGQLSGGQRQRVALGRSMIRDPRIILMDEPLSNLDAKLRAAARTQILELQRRLGTTTLYVTHDQVEALSLADRIAVLRDGVLVQVGPASAVYDRPVDLFVGRFVGSPPMAVVRATVVVAGRDVGLRVGTSGLVPLGPTILDEYPSLRRMDGREVAMGVRSEALRPDPAGPIRASVEWWEWIGPTRLLHVSVDAPGVRAADEGVQVSAARRSAVSLHVDAHATVNRWAPLGLAVDTDLIRVFDLASGRDLQLAPEPAGR